MSDISNEDRAKIVALHEHTSKSGVQIANDLGFSTSAVNKIIKRYKETGEYYSDRHLCQRPRKTDERGDRVLLRLSKKDPKASSSDLQRQLAAEYDIHLDSSTVRRRLLEMDRPAYRPVQCQSLTETQRKKRYDWACQYQNWTVENWRRVCFSDESMIEIQPNHSQFVRRNRDESLTAAHFQASYKHPVKVMLWGIMSYRGTGRLHVCEGAMNQEQYQTIIKTRVVPQLKDWFGDEACYFQHDLAPCHTAKSCLKLLETSQVNVLPWPGNSPDLSPIENLWAILKRRINKHNCSNKNELINEILNVWARTNDLHEISRSLIDSMPRRIDACIKARGGPIHY